MVPLISLVLILGLQIKFSQMGFPHNPLTGEVGNMLGLLYLPPHYHTQHEPGSLLASSSPGMLSSYVRSLHPLTSEGMADRSECVGDGLFPGEYGLGTSVPQRSLGCPSPRRYPNVTAALCSILFHQHLRDQRKL